MVTGLTEGSSNESKAKGESGSATPSSKDRNANDPFDFRALKRRWKEDYPSYPPISEADIARVEEELQTKGKAKVTRNVFDLKEVPKQMADMWMTVSTLASHVLTGCW